MEGGLEGGVTERGKGEKSVRLCELTTLPLAAFCTGGTKAAAASDCTPLKQRAAVIRPPPPFVKAKFPKVNAD